MIHVHPLEQADLDCLTQGMKRLGHKVSNISSEVSKWDGSLLCRDCHKRGQLVFGHFDERILQGAAMAGPCIKGPDGDSA